MNSDALYDALVELRDVCVAALPLTPGGLPDCVHLSPGVPAWDTMPSLTVHPGGPAVGDTFPLQPSLSPAHRITTNAQVDLYPLTVTILRCAPILGENGELPADSVFDDVTRIVTADLYVLWNAIKTAKRDGTLFAPREREVFLDPVVGVNQQGGATGWQIPLRVQLDGYTP